MKKRARTNVDKAVVGVWQREVGQLSTRNFAHRLGASEDLVRRLDIYRKLEKHRGCVNTVSFNADGGILVSGSDDKRVILWDWETGHVKLSFHSDHNNNVFQAKIMPYTNDRHIVTCAADGQVRLAQILEHGGVGTTLLAKHHGRAHNLAIEPGSPHIFYTCGEDGFLQHFDLRTLAATKLFTCQPVDDRRDYMSAIPLNAIAIDPRNPNLFAVAGLAFSERSELLVSYNDESIYLFTRDMGLGPNPLPASPGSMCSNASEIEGDSQFSACFSACPSAMDADEQSAPQVYEGHRNCDTVKGVNFFGPNCEYVVSGSDCGRIFIWKKKGGELMRVMEADKRVVNCIECHPHTMVLASSGIESDIKLWTPKALERASVPTNIEEVMHGRINWFASGSDDDDNDGDSDDDDDLFYDDDISDYDDADDNNGEEEEDYINDESFEDGNDSAAFDDDDSGGCKEC